MNIHQDVQNHLGEEVSKERVMALYKLLRSGNEVVRKDIPEGDIKVAEAILDVMSAYSKAIVAKEKRGIRLVELTEEELKDLEDHITLRNAAIYQKHPEFFSYVDAEGIKLTIRPDIEGVKTIELLAILKKISKHDGIIAQEKNWLIGEIVSQVRNRNKDYTLEGLADFLAVSLATMKAISHTYNIFKQIRFRKAPWAVHREIGYYSNISISQRQQVARFASKYGITKEAAVRVCKQIDAKGTQMFRHEKRLLELCSKTLPKNKQEFICVDSSGKFRVHRGFMTDAILRAYDFISQTKPVKSVIKDNKKWINEN